jgi:hypothetical protein
MKTAITLGLLAFMGRIGSITGLSSESLSIESARLPACFMKESSRMTSSSNATRVCGCWLT